MPEKTGKRNWVPRRWPATHQIDNRDNGGQRQQQVDHGPGDMEVPTQIPQISRIENTVNSIGVTPASRQARLADKASDCGIISDESKTEQPRLARHERRIRFSCHTAHERAKNRKGEPLVIAGETAISRQSSPRTPELRI